MFLAFQYPQEIPGVSVIQFLRQALSARKGIDLSVLELRVADDGVDAAPRHGLVVRRPLPQRGLLRRREEAQRDHADGHPRAASWRSSTRPTPGLDIDALRIVAKGIREVRADRPEMGVVLITHYQRLLDEVHARPRPRPDRRAHRRVAAGMEIVEHARARRLRGVPERRVSATPRLVDGSTTDRSTSPPSRPTSRCCSRRSTAAPIDYLDSANTSQKPRRGDRRDDARSPRRRTPPINRSAYRLAAEATDAYEAARAKVAALRQRPRRRRDRVHQERHRGAQPRRPVVGPGATCAPATSSCSPQMEHHANIVPWHMLAAERGIELRWVPLTADGQLDLTDLDRLLDGAKVVRLHGDEQRARHAHAGRRAVRGRPCRRRARRRRRLPVRAPQRHRRAGVGRRLRRLLRPQDVRARRASARCGDGPSCSRRCRRSSAAAT